MSKSTPQAPPAPDPALVAQNQTGSNINTAVAQKALNGTNQYTPFGSTTYQQTGTQNRRVRTADLQPDHDPEPGFAIDLQRNTKCRCLIDADGADAGEPGRRKRDAAARFLRRQPGLPRYRAAAARPEGDRRGLSAAEKLPRSAMAAAPARPRGSVVAAGHRRRQRRLQQRDEQSAKPENPGLPGGAGFRDRAGRAECRAPVQPGAGRPEAEHFATAAGADLTSRSAEPALQFRSDVRCHPRSRLP